MTTKNNKDIIDAILYRMSKLNRYSDDDTIIEGDELLPFDVIYYRENETEWFGVVQRKIGGAGGMTLANCINAQTGLRRMIHDLAIYQGDCAMRCIDETQSAQAHELLMQLYAGDDDVGH
ncbi:hypothetical protein SAMN02745664_10214 [Moraxella cuniculi DSM 21768]|uniref:Uncharacterized protein n=1 Tax=Moraxella cuniculi DSM 21768 TaxID=1122245 RepID=A0A1N7DPH0_9GAMM|nr:hypothetical protein [Moraxella cuniculi]OOS05976.1 hypothetical protein B0189_05790 [Moraxella cuniculi]SIR77756.1 hypothetical protein SAMN02745664_10214 [Moraxella cuniculi DSM 21768]